ncbi:hypothetical protein BH23THE1_BH23THE1_29760 [soil metagenome]
MLQYSIDLNFRGFSVPNTSPDHESNVYPLSGTAVQVASLSVAIIVEF